MNIYFFDVQDWEKELITTDYSDAKQVGEAIRPENAQEFQDAEVISCFIYSTLNREALEKLPNLKLIATRSTGFDHIDLDYCKAHSIVISNVPEYGSNTVAEHAFALLLNLTRKIYQSVNQCKGLSFQHTELCGIDLEGRTMGIVGMGKIGQHAARIAHGFGMKVLAFNRSQDPQTAIDLNFQYVDLDTLIQNSDVVSLHLPYLAETKHIINQENIRKFKKGSYLINTARGGLVDTEAILIGLQEDILDGVGLDVLEEEKELGEEVSILTKTYQENIDFKTLVCNHFLINHPKVLITPHNAFNSKEALLRIETTTFGNIKNFLSSNPSNVVTL
ncbi:hydroxyacid dehydrogenase [Candidatus Roizmanbacteria bacterium]|nr:hydroxyacid dehydrogenase [Candidatus Roizmanbacteria bacterium]